MSGPATPHAPLSARASQPPTGSATPALPPQPTAPAMPRPEELDILPDLHHLLSRLTAPPSLPTSGQPDKDKNGPLDVQQLSTETNPVKRKIQRARDKVLALPDIDRTIEDQREEIEDLETRIARLKAALRGLAEPTPKEEAADSSMTG